jgi:hypothetical protein
MLLMWPMNLANASERYAGCRYRIRWRRLRDAGISADMICQYVNVELAALDGLYLMAEAKLLAAQNLTDDRYHGCR